MKHLCEVEFMNDREFKFKNNMVYSVLGVVWFFFSLINFIGFVFFIRQKPSIKFFTVYMISMLLFSFVATIILGLYYLTLHMRTYIKITENYMQIHRGLVKKAHIIKYIDIAEIRMIGDKVYLVLNSNAKRKEIQIFRSYLYIVDFDELVKSLSKYKISIKCN